MNGLTRTISPAGLARTSARRPKTVLAVWATLLIISFGLLGAYFGSAFTTEFVARNNPEAATADALIADRLLGEETVQETVIIRSEQLTVDDPEFAAVVSGVRDELIALGPSVVLGAASYYEPGNEAFVSEDGHSTIVAVTLAGTLTDAEKNVELVYEIVDRAGESATFETLITGVTTFQNDFTEQAQSDAESGESLAIPIVILILAVIFGALAAVILPMGLAIASIILTMAAAAVFGQFYGDLHVFMQNIVTMIGLAVGIDYSLLIVSRFREERARGLDKLDAIEATGATAGRTVLFSGLTVVIALGGMLIVPINVMVSIAFGALFVVSIAVVAALTLLPAALSLMGDNISRFRVPFVNRIRSGGAEGGVWDRVSYAVMRRPWISLGVGVTVLVLMAAPLVTMNLGNSGISTFPDGLRAKEGFVALQEDFGFSADAPANIVIDGDVTSPAVLAAIDSLAADLAAKDAFGPAQLQINEAGDLAWLAVPVVGDPTARSIDQAVRELRDVTVQAAFAGLDVEVFVGGQTSANLDQIDVTKAYLPVVFALVLALSFALLLIVFRSIIVPIKAILLNLLSVGAAYGMIVLVFQHGVGASFLGFQEAPFVQAFIPLLLFAILFGLSMDYHVFLLSRIKERYEETGDNTESVAFGIRSTAGLITGAALIMVAVFAGFASGELVPLQQFGFGMAVAVFVDATIVRIVLVPASMQLLGDRNWYFPGFLRWLPEVRAEGRAPDPQPAPMQSGETSPVGGE